MAVTVDGAIGGQFVFKLCLGRRADEHRIVLEKGLLDFADGLENVGANGALNVSVLDGWWVEGYSREAGWAIGSGEEYDDAEYQESIARRHGAHGEEVAREFFFKHLQERDYRAEIDHLRSGWEDIWEGLFDVLRPAARVREILDAAGAPVNVRDLGLTADHLRRGYLAARDIRGRFTVLDLAADLCMLESSSEEVLASSGCL